MGKRAVELDPAEHAEDDRTLTQRQKFLLTFGPGRPSDDQAGWLRGWMVPIRANASRRRSTPLSGWIRPTKRSTGPGPRPKRRRADRLGSRPEHPMVDAGRGGAQAVGVGAVVLQQFGRLGRRRRHHTVRAFDHLMFGGDPQEALGRIVGPPVAVLDAAEGVEGVRQRDTQGPLDQEPRPARQPIVRVENLRRVRAQPRFDCSGEGPHVSRERRRSARGGEVRRRRGSPDSPARRRRRRDRRDRPAG